MMTDTARRRLISIVTPCYNEEQNVAKHFERIESAIGPFRPVYDFEYIYTDNQSTDRTFELLSQIARDHPFVRVLRFSRNIGANRAIYFGLAEARGDAVILIQADLQDPPELIPEFIRRWEEGADTVYGEITRRDEGALLQNLRRGYYKAVATLSDFPVPENAGEFRLTTRRVVDAILRYTEDDLYVRGAVAHVGFPQVPVPYVRQRRTAGRSSMGLSGLASYALEGILSTTVVPIRIVTLAGLSLSVLGILITAGLVVSKLLLPDAAPHGFTTVAALIGFFAGAQMFALGIIGEYIRKIYIQALGRPRGFIQDRVGG